MVEDEIAALIARAKKNDHAAGGTLLACYRPLLAALVAQWSATVSDEVVERDELWQEAYRSFLELVRTYQVGSPVAFGAYVRHSLGWRLANYIRAERRRRRLSTALETEHLDLLHEEMRPNLGPGWDNPRLRAAFRTLSPKQRGVIARIYLQERAVRDVAAALGLSDNAVRSMCRRAEAKLRRGMSR